MSAPGPGQDMAGPPLRPPGGPQQPPRPQPPPGAQLAGPPRPFLPGGAVAPPRGPVPPRPSGPNSFAPQQPRPPLPQGSPVPPGTPVQQGPPIQGPPRVPGPRPPIQQHPSLEKQNSFQNRPPAPFLNQQSRQSSLASLGPQQPGAPINRPPMDPEGTPPAIAKNRSFSIAGPPGAVPGIPHHDDERRRSVSALGGRPEEAHSRSPGLAFIKEGVQSSDIKESPLNIGLTRLSKEDINRGSRESVRSDTSEGKGIERPESRLSGSRMTESIIGSLDTDERKSVSPKIRRGDDDDDVVTHNNKHPATNGTPNKSPSPNPVQENGHKGHASPVPPLDRSPSLTKSDSSPDQKPLNKTDSPNRPSSAISNASNKTPEPGVKPPASPYGDTKESTRPPSALSTKSEHRVDTPEIRNGTPENVNVRPGSRSGNKPTDFGTPIKTNTSDDKKATPTRKAMSAPRGRREGDNDSGVDESTQGNEVNGSPGSPGKKSPSKIPGLKGQSATPGGKSGVMRSPSKSATAHTPNTPDSATSNTSIEKKKIPMNKVQVGAAPSPNIKSVKSKIGSLENATHKPGGGKVRIENRKLDFNKATPRIAAKNDTYVPGGGDKKITQKKLQWNAKSKIGSLDNTTHKPGGGDKKIESVKLDFKDKAKPKIASTANLSHKPGGGDVKIENQKLEIKAQSKVGSLDNVKHKPGGGDVKIFDDKDYLKQIANNATDNVSSPPCEDCGDYVSLQDMSRRRQSMGPQSALLMNGNGSARSRMQRPRTARDSSAHRMRNASPRKCQTPRIEYERPPFRIY